MTQGSAKGAYGNWPGSTSIVTVGTLTTGTWLANSISKLAEGRLTLTSNTPVTTSDVTAATTLYYTPFMGNRIALYNGSVWKDSIFTELSIAVPATTNTMYDIWIYLNGVTPTLELLAWTNDTTRATALSTQDGIYIKSGDATRRYLGSFRTTGVSGQTEDSLTKRYLWNYYNRVLRQLRVTDTTDNWTYSTATWRQARATASNQIDMVIGVSEDVVEAQVFSSWNNSGATFRQCSPGIGISSTSVNSAQILSRVGCNTISIIGTSLYKGFPGVGRYYLAWLEYGGGADTQTWYGDAGLTVCQNGLHATIRG